MLFLRFLVFVFSLSFLATSAAIADVFCLDALRFCTPFARAFRLCHETWPFRAWLPHSDIGDVRARDAGKYLGLNGVGVSFPASICAIACPLAKHCTMPSVNPAAM